MNKENGPINKIHSQLMSFAKLYRQLFGKFELPDFLIIGAQKCGTSSLYSYLIQHPGIIAPAKKEIHYFSNPYNQKRGKSWYASHFCTVSYKKSLKKKLGYWPITGEATPDMHMPFMPESVHELLPSAKLIAMFRDPVKRAFSQYQHDRKYSKKASKTFKEAIDQSSLSVSSEMQDLWSYTHNNKQLSYIRRGLYAEQLEHWYQYYSKDCIHIIISDEFSVDPAKEMAKVLQFLNMPEFDFDVSTVKNVGNYKEQMDKDVREYLISVFRPQNQRLFKLIGRNLDWSS